MFVYVAFDVEDLVHPDSDDIPRDIADLLADDGIVASMCVCWREGAPVGAPRPA